VNAAVIGLGSIGGAIALRLAQHDVPLTVFDLREDAGTAAEAAGARRASSCGDAAAGADVVVIAVLDDAQVLDVVTSPQGILQTAGPGTIVVIHSTVRLDTVRKVATASAAQGVRVVDAGVSTRGTDEAGTLELFVGGDPGDVDAARPVLEHYAHHLDYLGDLGSGMTAKLVRNLLGYTLMAAANEALALAEEVGVNLDEFRRVLDESDVVSQYRLALSVPTTRPVTESDAAAQFHESTLGLGGEDLVAALEHYVYTMQKDIDDALALADDAGFTLELAPHARAMLRRVLLLPAPG